MYRYELVNNHYIVDIEGKKFLIDTGGHSIWFKKPVELTIGGRKYPISKCDWEKSDIDKTLALVGVDLDGFIGLDVIMRTSLTIYKNGDIDFKPHDVDGGVRVPLNTTYGLLSFDAVSNGISGQYVIDTGAMYGYGLKELFAKETPFLREAYDFNPKLKEMYSDIYHHDVEIMGHHKIVDMGYNKDTMGYPLGYSLIMIGNVTTFFDEVCVIDINKRLFILK